MTAEQLQTSQRLVLFHPIDGQRAAPLSEYVSKRLLGACEMKNTHCIGWGREEELQDKNETSVTIYYKECGWNRPLACPDVIDLLIEGHEIFIAV